MPIAINVSSPEFLKALLSRQNKQEVMLLINELQQISGKFSINAFIRKFKLEKQTMYLIDQYVGNEISPYKFSIPLRLLSSESPPLTKEVLVWATFDQDVLYCFETDIL